MPDTNRNRVLVVMTNVFLHLHPVKIRKSGIRLKFTWCMGGLTFFLFLVETFTGLLLMFTTGPPWPTPTWTSWTWREQVPLGIMREIHRWGAHAMVITVWLHMFRVFMTGSYKPPREFNWNVGVIPAGADAALVHRLPAALGPAGHLGHHRRLQHGARDADTRARRARCPVARLG
jgi:quinol-cytochrome oxidoreductase complex cytochrome b subunit